MFTISQTDTPTEEYAKLHKQLAHNLKETAPTNIEELNAAHFRKLMEACNNDIATRNNRGLRASADKKTDDAEIAQLTKDFIEPLNYIFRSRITTEPVAIISYKKMKGNYCRYIAEYLTDHDKREQQAYFDGALSAYLEAKEDAASSGLNPCDPLCLELHFSIAKLYYAMKLFRSARWTNALTYRTLHKAEDLERLDEENRKLSEDILNRMERMRGHWTHQMLNGNTGDMSV
ncbi:hypothetical protein BGZ95_010567 [Linnemannia exigua]|uniref:14-3-3 domain-containing protein n=1 Tax=Linnemannia exigua TaxID=604196 RepID=A0AAD4DCW2_9FUNG|nr:hypothetical protein BGZ95_010567 [Linnemannia exigua]